MEAAWNVYIGTSSKQAKLWECGANELPRHQKCAESWALVIA